MMTFRSKRIRFKQFVLILLSACAIVLGASGVCHAQATDDQLNDDKDAVMARLTLAEELVALRPVNVQVDRAIERFVRAAPQEQRPSLSRYLAKALNPAAIEQVTIDTYVDLYTEAELRALLRYYGDPQVSSALAKSSAYSAAITSHITRLLDQAAIESKLNQN